MNDITIETSIPFQETEQYHDITLKKSMPIGLLLALTYPEEITVNSKKF